MSVFIVPNGVSSTDCAVLLCLVDEPDSLIGSLHLTVNGLEHAIGPWSNWTSEDKCHRIQFQELPINTLNSDTKYTILVTSNVGSFAAEINTLPATLPKTGERPFTILLGSCFYLGNDSNGDAGRCFSGLPENCRPHVKILCGDQVYLDAPWYKFLWPRSAAWLQQELLRRYVEGWGQNSSGNGGFQTLLSRNANYLCSDDHEFWNNAPFPGAYVANTWQPTGRQFWRDSAEQFFRMFQTSTYPQKLSMGNLSIFVTEMRIPRDDQRKDLMDRPQLLSLKAWLSSLTGPGVLVTGQPLFATKAGFVGHFADWNLPDFDQYEEIVQAVAATTHDLLLLTGDVHFGRIARCKLPSGINLIEIISSPMSLVDKSVGGKWNAAPNRFPSVNVPGVPAMPVTTEKKYTMTDNHFLTLSFWSTGPRVNVAVNVWPVSSRSSGTGQQIFNETLN